MKNMELDKVARQYILDAISAEGYDNEDGTPAELKDSKDALAFLYKTFVKEYGFMFDGSTGYRHTQERAFKEWIMGLPSSFNVDFENYKILQIAVKWGSIPADYTERQADKILANWFNFITVKTFQLFKKYKVNQ